MKPDQHGAEQDSMLLAWWLDELGDGEAAEFEEHLFGCETCAARLRELLALRDSVRQAVNDSHFSTAVTAGFVYFADASGTQIGFTIRGQHVFHSADATTEPVAA